MSYATAIGNGLDIVDMRIVFDIRGDCSEGVVLDGFRRKGSAEPSLVHSVAFDGMTTERVPVASTAPGATVSQTPDGRVEGP